MPVAKELLIIKAYLLIFKTLTHVYLWQIHFDIWQKQYNIVKLKNKIKFRKKCKKKKKKLLECQPLSFHLPYIFILYIFMTCNLKNFLKQLIYNIILASGIQQSDSVYRYIYTQYILYPLHIYNIYIMYFFIFFILFSIMVYYRVLNIVLGVTEGPTTSSILL